jgi:hypothetical protein
MARDVAAMFDELKVLADRHAELHVDRARLKRSWRANVLAWLVRVRTQIGSLQTMPPNWSRFGMKWSAPARIPAYGVKRPTASAPASPTCRPTLNIPNG